MSNSEIIFQFYRSFARGNADELNGFYHDQVVFEDPAFGKLKGEEVRNMWRMLIDRSRGNIKITCEDIMANEKKGSAIWQATYYFGHPRRKVINRVHAKFEFADGKIIKHTDRFSFWKWSRQALGWKGILFGWTPMMKAKFRKESRIKLLNYSPVNQTA